MTDTRQANNVNAEDVIMILFPESACGTAKCQEHPTYADSLIVSDCGTFVTSDVACIALVQDNSSPHNI